MSSESGMKEGETKGRKRTRPISRMERNKYLVKSAYGRSETDRNSKTKALTEERNNEEQQEHEMN